MITEVALTGAGGRMGRVIAPALEREPGIRLVAVIGSEHPAQPVPGVPLRCSDLERALDETRPQVVVDFTAPAYSLRVIAAAHARGASPVVGTTGFTARDRETIAASCERSGLPAIVIANFSLGATILARLAREAARHLKAFEIVELHHEGKRDAPSGTALRLASALGGGPAPAGNPQPSRGLPVAGVPVHSLRLPGLVAHHMVILGGQGEYLTLRHDSTSRECFLPGLLLAIRRVSQCRGLVQDLESLLQKDSGTGTGEGT